jgi:hypothetical protein
VAFIPADIFPTVSGAPRDGGFRTARDETPPESVRSRKGFSSVLRSVRGEVGKATIREAEGPRPVNKADGGSRTKKAKGHNDLTQPARPHASSSQEADGPRNANDEDQLAGDTRAGYESSPRQNDVGSGSQEQGTTPIANLISVPAQPQVVDQTDVQTETELHPFGDATTLDTDARHPLISYESTESFETTPGGVVARSLKNSGVAASDLSATQQSGLLELQPNNDEPGVQGAEGAAEEVVKESRKVAADHGDSRPASRDSFLGSALSPGGPGIPHIVQPHVGTTSLEGDGLVTQDETLKHDRRPDDHPAPSPAAQHMPALDDHEALGASTEQSFSHGQQPGSDGSKPFSEQWSDHDEGQSDDRETNISHTFVVNHQVSNGSGGESVSGGVPSQSISASVAPPQASLSTHVQPSLRADDMAQSAGNPAMRSVVVNVHQPDLGHVNIRVAMTNDLVHTHFSSDRLEVGQFFINGQDRLQAALQASGLDMGQFRVDIDRQSGGRSFQQGPSQEHGQPWNQGSHGMVREPNSDQQDLTRGARHGLLNVVA